MDDLNTLLQKIEENKKQMNHLSFIYNNPMKMRGDMKIVSDEGYRLRSELKKFKNIDKFISELKFEIEGFKPSEVYDLEMQVNKFIKLLNKWEKK